MYLDNKNDKDKTRITTINFVIFGYVLNGMTVLKML